MALPYSSAGRTNAVNNFVTIDESRCSNDLLINHENHYHYQSVVNIDKEQSETSFHFLY